MIKVEHIEVNGIESAIRGMRNPMNSWDKSDGSFVYVPSRECYKYLVGDNDLDLMQRLYKAGSDHRKYMRMITVAMDITAPLYWWKEFDTYKVGTVANSCSTMHKIHAKEFTIDDFSHENLLDEVLPYNWNESGLSIMQMVVNCLNCSRDLYLETKDKKYWYQMIQLLPSSYNQKRTVLLNLEVIDNMVRNRKHHKLNEWQELVKEFENIEIYKMITGGKNNDK